MNPSLNMIPLFGCCTCIGLEFPCFLKANLFDSYRLFGIFGRLRLNCLTIIYLIRLQGRFPQRYQSFICFIALTLFSLHFRHLIRPFQEVLPPMKLLIHCFLNLKAKRQSQS
jgi:hypothetical protein